MNQRIKELYLQAVEYSNGQMTFGDTREYFAEKFAELIITECMAQCTKVEEDDELCGVSDGALLCREEIKEHFGVKE